MYIRLSIPENVIEWEKLSDLEYIFGNKMIYYFKKREYNYIYSYPVDIEVNEEHILQLMNKGYRVIFINNTMEIK